MTVDGGHEGRFWDTATGQPASQPLVVASDDASVLLHPAGKGILVVDGETAQMWSIPAGQTVGKPIETLTRITTATYSLDTEGNLSQTIDHLEHLVTSPSRAQKKTERQAVVQGNLLSVAFSLDGNFVVTGGDDCTASVWDVRTGRRTLGPLMHVGEVRSVAFSPDGSTIVAACGGKTPRIWGATLGKEQDIRYWHEGSVVSATLSPDGTKLLTASLDGKAVLWDVASGQSIGQPMVHRASLSAAIFSPSGRTVATGSEDSTVRLWDAASGQPVGQPLVHQGSVTSVAFSPDGKIIVTGSKDSKARLWDAASCRPLGQPLVHQDRVNSVAFSPSGETVLTGSADRTARLWHVDTKQPIGLPLSHVGAVNSVAFSPNGKTIVTASDGNSARLWQIPTPVDDDFPRIEAWVETITGLVVNGQGDIHSMDSVAWQDRRRRLRLLGGPPMAEPGWLLDPIRFGSDPTRRARAWLERQQWNEAEKELTELVRTRPTSSAVFMEFGLFSSTVASGSELVL